MTPGPVECDACGELSAKIYRCTECGSDLAVDHSTEGRHDV